MINYFTKLKYSHFIYQILTILKKQNNKIDLENLLQ